MSNTSKLQVSAAFGSGAEGQFTNNHPTRLARLAAHPHLEAYEQLLAEYTEDTRDDFLQNFQSDLVRQLEVAWAAARAVFGDAATADVAWKIYKLTDSETSSMA